jgi:hypothetical protein
MTTQKNSTLLEKYINALEHEIRIWGNFEATDEYANWAEKRVLALETVLKKARQIPRDDRLLLVLMDFGYRLSQLTKAQEIYSK